MGWTADLAIQLRQPVRARVWAVVLPAFAAYVVLLLAGQHGLPSNERYRQNLHGLISVQCAIERSTDGSRGFPLRIEPLMAGMDPSVVPINWYGRTRTARPPMRLVELGSSDYCGNYSYIPVLADGEVCGYYLLVYGNRLTPGRDVDNDGRPDHVVHVLSSNSVDGNLMECWQGRTRELPPLEVAIAQWREFRSGNAGLWRESAGRLTTLSGGNARSAAG
ncbi:hypothetical protein KDL44_10245 [bacterium]|nr:hypothetical protein [bacterium]